MLTGKNNKGYFPPVQIARINGCRTSINLDAQIRITRTIITTMRLNLESQPRGLFHRKRQIQIRPQPAIGVSWQRPASHARRTFDRILSINVPIRIPGCAKRPHAWIDIQCVRNLLRCDGVGSSTHGQGRKCNHRRLHVHLRFLSISFEILRRCNANSPIKSVALPSRTGNLSPQIGYRPYQNTYIIPKTAQFTQWRIFASQGEKQRKSGGAARRNATPHQLRGGNI